MPRKILLQSFRLVFSSEYIRNISFIILQTAFIGLTAPHSLTITFKTLRLLLVINAGRIVWHILTIIIFHIQKMEIKCICTGMVKGD